MDTSIIDSLDTFYKQASEHVAVFDAFVRKHQMEGSAVADHICFKCGSTSTYESLRALLEPASDFIYQSVISNRRIAYIKLAQGIETELGTLYFLELSDQKPDNSQREGFDHIEVFPIKTTYDAFVSLLAQTEEVQHVARPHHTTDDIKLENGFIFRCTTEPLLEKIKREEMQSNV